MDDKSSAGLTTNFCWMCCGSSLKTGCAFTNCWSHLSSALLSSSCIFFILFPSSNSWMSWSAFFFGICGHPFRMTAFKAPFFGCSTFIDPSFHVMTYPSSPASIDIGTMGSTLPSSMTMIPFDVITISTWWPSARVTRTFSHIDKSSPGRAARIGWVAPLSKSP